MSNKTETVELTPQKSNKVIAEFMGWKRKGAHGQWFDGEDRQRNYLPDYSESFDALIPVWEEYSKDTKDWPRQTYILGLWSLFADAIKRELFIDPDLTIQEAAAVATAREILASKGLTHE